MGTVAMEAVQAVVEARQDYDAITYGIRSIEVSGHSYGASACHVAQIRAACQAAARVTGRFVGQDNATKRALQTAKAEALTALRAAEAEKKAAGNARQIRMALAA